MKIPWIKFPELQRLSRTLEIKILKLEKILKSRGKKFTKNPRDENLKSFKIPNLALTATKSFIVWKLVIFDESLIFPGFDQHFENFLNEYFRDITKKFLVRIIKFHIIILHRNSLDK